MRASLRRRLSGASAGSESLSLAVLGVGNIGTVHLGSALAMDDVTVVAAADAVAENRQRAEKMGVPRTYDDYAALLESESPDAAVVALPPFLHAEAVERAAEAGVDVFVEKPLARTVEEAEAMLEAADEAGIRVGVDHTLRYQPDVVGVKEAYEEGRIGRVPFASMVRINDDPFGRPPVEDAPPSWRLDPDAVGGGALLELGVHCFDVLEWLFGDLEVRDAQVDATLDLPLEDAATVSLRAPETETAISLHCGTYQWEDLPEVNTRLALQGVTGTIENEEYLPENFYASAATSALGNVASRFTGDDPDVYGPTFYYRAHYDALADFAEAILADEAPPVDGETGKRTLELAETAYELAGRNGGADGDGDSEADGDGADSLEVMH
ncbi:Gfo/Idh/MocA family protein [Natrialbaceae archaeon GCM10025810]|uniref:Gfo/Idh/MocA family protein n=1 Tax=Halovalidus salilacus TaxID=3075124 RepID=UPI003620D8DA